MFKGCLFRSFLRFVLVFIIFTVFFYDSVSAIASQDYSVTVDPNGGTHDGFSDTHSYQGAAGDSRIIPDAVKNNGLGWTFSGWDIEHSVEFDTGGHGSAPSRQLVPDGSKVVRPSDPAAENWLFRGWYKDTACTSVWNFNSDVVSRGTTIHAKWDPCDHTGAPLIVNYTVQPTCITAGKAYQECTLCGHKYDVYDVPATEHSYSAWMSANSSVNICTSSGTAVRTCMNPWCTEGTPGHTQTKSVSAMGHDLDVGYYFCKSCGQQWPVNQYGTIKSGHKTSSGSSCGGSIYQHKACMRTGCNYTSDILARTITYTSSGSSIDIRAGGAGTTYGNHGFYMYGQVVDVGSSNSASSSQTSLQPNGSNTISGVIIKSEVFIDDSNRTVAKFTVTNTNSVDKKVAIALGADTMINGCDKHASVVNAQGIKMTGSGVDFQLYGRNTTGVTDMDSFWVGTYSSYPSNLYTMIDGGSISSSIDAGMAASWHDRRIIAGTSQEFICMFGLT